MPLTAYMKIPDIAGESQRVDHEDEIDVHDIAWSVEQAPSATMGRGRRRSRPDMRPLLVRKFYDAASPYLAKAVHSGKAFPEMVLSVRKDSGDAHLDYLVITMENVVISSYDVGTDETVSDSGQLTEEVELDFENITILYTSLTEDGSEGDEHEVTLEN